MSHSRRSARFDAHHRLILAVVIAAVTFACLGHYRLEPRTIATWNAFAGTILAGAWFRMLRFDARTSVQETRLQDSGRTGIFSFVVISAVVSLLAVGWLLTSPHLSPRHPSLPILLASATVVLSWGLIHTMFTLHYAHIYYARVRDTGDGEHRGGLQFPEDEHPGFLDFAYFSFIIGMTCQVSDVAITSKRIRRLALCHGALSFAFNTIILALTINLASTVLTK